MKKWKYVEINGNNGALLNDDEVEYRQGKVMKLSSGRKRWKGWKGRKRWSVPWHLNSDMKARNWPPNEKDPSKSPKSSIPLTTDWYYQMLGVFTPFSMQPSYPPSRTIMSMERTSHNLLPILSTINLNTKLKLFQTINEAAKGINISSNGRAILLQKIAGNQKRIS